MKDIDYVHHKIQDMIQDLKREEGESAIEGESPQISIVDMNLEFFPHTIVLTAAIHQDVINLLNKSKNLLLP